MKRRIYTASMRPREFPAESADLSADAKRTDEASMRPREFPAESLQHPGISCGRPVRFNEAAGVPRGIHLNGAVGRDEDGKLQ